MKEQIPVVAVIGPTAVGKTALSLELAACLDAEVVSVDSRQVYRYMDVGTDKISPSVRKIVLHHLIDIADPDEIFNVALFVRFAQDAVDRIQARGRTPLFVGGTPFYYNALFSASITADLPEDKKTRVHFEKLAKEEGAEALHKMLAEADPKTAARLHPNDVRRVSRALEINALTGTPPSLFFTLNQKARSGMNVLYVGLNRPRGELFDTITQRVRRQFSSGYPEEVKWLLDNGFDESFPSMQGFGYKELVAWHRGTLTLEEALEGDIRRTKAFCRRQMTWFKKFSPVLWYDVSTFSASDLLAAVLEPAKAHLQR